MARYIQYPYRPRPVTAQPANNGMLVSAWGQEFDLPTSSIRLNPARMGSILRQADNGDTQAMYEMFHAVEQDPQVHTALSKRKLATTSRMLQITPSIDEAQEGEPEDPLRQKAIEAADLCNQLIFGSGGYAGIDNWQQSMLDIADGIGRGFSLNQIIWERDAERDLHVPIALQYWPQSDCVLGNYGAEQYVAPDIIRLAGDNGGTPEELVYGQWVRHVHKVRSDIIARAALLRIVAWWYLFKHFSVADWGTFIERYGMPLRLGKYSPSAQDEERRVLRQAVIELGKSAGAILPDSTAIEMVESKIGSGSIPHEGHSRFCDEQITKAILGQSLSTDAGDRGARSLGETQMSGSSQIYDDDAARIAETIRRDLCGPIVAFNLGQDFPVPNCALASRESKDPMQMAKRDQLLVSMGLPIGVNYLYEAHEIPPPEEGEETIGKKQPAPNMEPAEDEQPEDEAPPTDEEIASSLDRGTLTPLRLSRGRVFAWTGEAWHAMASNVKKKSRHWVTPMI